MTYRVTNRFVRLEALGSFGQNGRYNDPADPISLEVRVTDALDINSIVESSTIASSDANKPFRLATGIWAFDLNATLYGAGKQYTVNFIYSMTPSNKKVDRYTFTWAPTPALPRSVENCVVFGTVADVAGNPLPDIRITVEQYRDFVSLNHRVGSLEIVSDVFGNWFVEVPRKSILRFVYGDLFKTVLVPELNRASLSDIVPYQPADIAKDKYGYPLP